MLVYMMGLRYAIIGTGAIGTVIGLALLEAGHDVLFVAKSNFAMIESDGLSVIRQSDGRTVTHSVEVYDDIRKIPPCDVLVILTKATTNEHLTPHLASVLKQDGCVLVLQNGIDYESAISGKIDSEKILGGVCYIKASKVSDAVVNHSGQTTVAIAPFLHKPGDEVTQARIHLNQIAIDFQASGLNVTVSNDLNTIRWEKLIINIPFNGLSVCLGASNHELFANEMNYVRMKTVMLEVIEAAQACGAKISKEEFFHKLEKIREKFLHDPDGCTSMKEDYDHGRPMELKAIFENAITLGEKVGKDMPFTREILTQLSTMLAEHQSGRPILHTQKPHVHKLK